MQDRRDFGLPSLFCANEVSVPEPASIFQCFVDVSLDPLPQVFNLRVDNASRKPAHIPLQPSIHQFETTDQKFSVLIGRMDTESWIHASGWIDDEVWEGLVEGSDGVVLVVLENEERVGGI